MKIPYGETGGIALVGDIDGIREVALSIQVVFIR